MWTVVRIALRNTRRQGRRGVLLGTAIAFSVMVITLLNAFTAGAVSNIKNNLAYVVGGHVFITGTELVDGRREVDRIGDDARLQAALAAVEDRVVSVHRRSTAVATFIFGSKAVTYALEGVDFAAEPDFAKGLAVREGTTVFDAATDPRAVILPASVAERLGVMVGETVLVRLLTITGQQNVGELRVAAVTEELQGFGLTAAYTSLQYLNSLLGLAPGEYQTFSVVVRDVREIDTVADQLYAALQESGALVERPAAQRRSRADMEEEGMAVISQLFGQAAVRLVEEPWEGTKFSLVTLNELMQPVVSAMTVLDAIARGIFVVLLLITAIGITNTFRMVIIERTREIGTMRAFGMQKSMVRSIFLWEAALIALAGGAAGLLAAGVIAGVVSSLDFSHVRGFEFFLEAGHVTMNITAADLALNMAIVLGICLAAAWLPASAAANLPPVKALGAHY